MTSVIGIGRRHQAVSMNILDRLAREEAQRNATNEQMREGEDAQRQQMVGQFAGMGAYQDLNRYRAARADQAAVNQYTSSPLTSAEQANMATAKEQVGAVHQPMVDPAANPGAYDAAGNYVGVGAEQAATEGASQAVTSGATQTVAAETGTGLAVDAAVSQGAGTVAGQTTGAAVGSTGSAVAGSSTAAVGTGTAATATGAGAVGAGAGAASGAAASGTGAAAGTATGAEVGSAAGPWGAVIGAAAGLILSQLF